MPAAYMINALTDRLSASVGVFQGGLCPPGERVVPCCPPAPSRHPHRYRPRGLCKGQLHAQLRPYLLKNQRAPVLRRKHHSDFRSSIGAGCANPAKAAALKRCRRERPRPTADLMTHLNSALHCRLHLHPCRCGATTGSSASDHVEAPVQGPPADPPIGEPSRSLDRWRSATACGSHTAAQGSSFSGSCLASPIMSTKVHSSCPSTE